MTKVALSSIYNGDFTYDAISGTVSEAIDLLSCEMLQNHDIETVVIKPNLSYYWDYTTGETTDPRVVSSIIDHIRKKTDKRIRIIVAEADASAMRTKYAFKILGYENLCREKNVELLNLSEGEIVQKEVTVDNKKFALPINKILLESNLIINVPKLKYHRQQGMTCALKNMFGAISKPKKIVYHNELSRVIVAINKIVKSNLVIVDGLIALGKYPKKMGVIIASDNPFAADFTAARIMGYNPKRISHLNLAMKEKIGNPRDINLIASNTTLEKVASNFPRRNYLLQKASWKLQLSMLRTYARLIGDTIPPVLEE